jgi:hypothetical protein
MSARVRSSTNSYNQAWLADLSSTYVVNGEYYSGFHRIRARSEGRTEERMLAGRAEWSLCGIPPTRTNLSALRRGDQAGNRGTGMRLGSRTISATPEGIPLFGPPPW